MEPRGPPACTVTVHTADTVTVTVRLGVSDTGSAPLAPSAVTVAGSTALAVLYTGSTTVLSVAALRLAAFNSERRV